MSEHDPASRDSSDRQMELIEEMFRASHRENVRWRRWTIFFRLFAISVIAIIIIVELSFLSSAGGGVPAPGDKHTALVEVNGVIAEGQDANADRIVTGLREAFKADKSEAVLLRINSPGGSPVQAGQVYREIQRLRKKHPEKNLYAAITDMGASGGYYIAAAADKIYADPASIVGSIGVIMAGFGFTDAIDKLGVERRMLTAGKNKDILDPFQPVDPDQQAHVKDMLGQIHEQFIEAVKKGRGDRLADPARHQLFSGLFWTGEKAVELGLADGLKSPGEVAREVVGAKDIVNYTPRKNPFDQLLSRLGTSIGEGISEAMGTNETRLR